MDAEAVTERYLAGIRRRVAWQADAAMRLRTGTPVEPEPEPEPEAAAAAEAAAAPEPEPEPEAEPVPEPEAEGEPEPEPVPPPAESGMPEPTDLAGLARIVETFEDGDLREEARYTLFELRRYGDVDGMLPPELVDEVFGRLAGTGPRAAQRS